MSDKKTSKIWVGIVVFIGLVAVVALSLFLEKHAVSHHPVPPIKRATPAPISIKTVFTAIPLGKVACPSITLCWGVGESASAHHHRGGAVEWTAANGWGTVQGISGSNYFDGIACPSTTLCWAVGYSSVSPSEGAVVEWTATNGWGTAQDISGTHYFNAISCPSATLCWAVGRTSSEGAVVEWTATNGWGTVQDISGVASTSYFYSISCPSTTLCWAVGSNSNNEDDAVKIQ